jgi:hypothetical protein
MQAPQKKLINAEMSRQLWDNEVIEETDIIKQIKDFADRLHIKAERKGLYMKNC